MIQSFDIFMPFYERNLALFGDVRHLSKTAEKENWSNCPDFHKTLVFKKQAIIIKTLSGQTFFTSSNMDEFSMSLLTTLPLYQGINHIYDLEIYQTIADE